MIPLVVSPDLTLRPGMKVLYGSRREDRVFYKNDVVYSEIDGQPLHLQILRPGMEPDLRFPLILYIQGSGWRKQDCYNELPNLYPLAKAGYVVASVEHRASTVAPFPAAVTDVKAAIRFLRAHADEFCIDPEQVGVFGSSSGGHLALMTGLTGDMEEFKNDQYADQSDAVKAIVDFFGPTDVTHINDAPRGPELDLEGVQPEDDFFGGCVREHPEISQKGNPLNYVTPNRKLPPILIAHGDQDDLVPFQQSVLMYDKLKECNQLVEFYKVLSVGHGIYMWTEEMMDIVVRFFEMYLK